MNRNVFFVAAAFASAALPAAAQPVAPLAARNVMHARIVRYVDDDNGVLLRDGARRVYYVDIKAARFRVDRTPVDLSPDAQSIDTPVEAILAPGYRPTHIPEQFVATFEPFHPTAYVRPRYVVAPAPYPYPVPYPYARPAAPYPGYGPPPGAYPPGYAPSP